MLNLNKGGYIMKTTKSILGFIITTVFCLASAPDMMAQNKLQESPGGYHGELDYPMSFKRYYAYDEWTGIMKDMAKKYSHLATVESIGKSRMGRDQYVMTITNPKTGKHSEKTAMWVDGAVHGNEVNGISCSMYLIWYLLTRYDYDEYVHNLVNNYTFYVLPGLNVDANDSFVMFPNTANNPREPYRPEDNDGDGLFDEDQTEDVDGDGELSEMYIEDPKGPLKLSEDKRRFVAVEDETYPGLRFKRIGSEGFDNDGDGLINEDDIGGPDPNRNFPYGWNMEAGNPYPMSEPCTRNVWEFQIAHPNIFASFHYHNTGRLVMFQAPQPVERGQNPQGQSGPYGMGGRASNTEERLAQLRKENKYAQLFDRQVAREFQHDLDVQTDIVTTGARILKNYTPVFGGLSGQAHAATYNMMGAYAYLVELWGTPTHDIDINGDGRASDEEYMQWIDIEMTGEGWITPHKAKHPDLGEIWIGGSAKKHMRRTPPDRYIEQEADKNAKFVMYCASQFPKVEVDDIVTTDLGKGLYWVDITVKNDRSYPTASDRAKKLKLWEQDILTLNTSKGVSIIKLDAKLPIQDPYQGSGGYYGFSRGGGAIPASDQQTKLWINGKSKSTVRYLVKVEGNRNWVEAEILSQRGGSDKMKFEF
jgi:hypothetical protein